MSKLSYRVIPVTAYQQNCSLVWCPDSGKAALIDPGGEPEKLLRAVEREGVRLEKLLLTHGHLDHVGAALELSQRLAIPIVGPQREDLFWLDALAQQAQMFGFPPLERFVPDQWLEDGDRIALGAVDLQVLHCPGHTPGHVVFYHEAGRIAFVGDVLFAGSVGRTDFPRGDHRALIESIVTKLLPLGDEVTFVPGHGPRSTFGAERLGNPFLTGDLQD